MMKVKWTRIAGLCALAALTFHGAGTLGQGGSDLELRSLEIARSGLEADQLCVLGLLLLVLLLQEARTAGTLPIPVAAGCVATASRPPTFTVLSRRPLSRGPPA